MRIPVYIEGIDLPQQTLDLLLDLPPSVYAEGEHGRAEEYGRQDARGHDAVRVAVVFGTVLVQESTTRLGLGLVFTRPLHRQRRSVRL